MTRIALAMIVRDAGSTLRACLESLKPHVDFIAICDTGSTDDSVAIGQEFADRWELYTGCNVNPLTGEPSDQIWDFADARNKSFAMIPDDCEFALWVDADDVVLGAENLRAAAANAPPGTFAYLMPYEYSYDAAGNCTCVHWRERLIRNPKDMVWTTPCHEVCMPRSGPIAHDQLDTVRLKHRAQWAAAQPGAKPREQGRNLRILRAYLQRVGESDPRAMYYCGVEYARVGAHGAAQDMLERYAEISGWADEKCLAELELGRIAMQTGGFKQAVKWALQATTTKAWPDPYFLMARAFFGMAQEGATGEQDRNLRRAYKFYEDGARLPDAETVLFYNPTERFEIEKVVNRISAHFGDIDGAAESCRRGLKGLPGDPELFEQLKIYESVRIGKDVDTALARLVALGRISQQVSETVQGLLTGTLSLPPAPVAANDTAPQPMQVGTAPPVDEASLPAVPDGKLDIVIFTGPAMEQWTPKTIEETGIGGSETMAWEMCRGLARLGHRVRHYGMCAPEQEGVYDGVHWFDMSRFASVRCDVLVVSRYAAFVDATGVEAKVRVAWTHDVHLGEAFTPDRALRFDRVLVLSNWHKEYMCQVYPYLDPSRVIVTRNGIDLSLFEGTEERRPHRAVYSSSPDRGLQTALELWPLVRAEVPDAELHVYYGFAGLRAIQPALADALEAKARSTEGVVLHGRVSPRELAREFLRSGVLFYPQWFAETSMIGAMQAQAAGLRIIASPIAAVNETVGDAGFLVPGAPGPIDITRSFECGPPSEEFARMFVKATVLAMGYDELDRRADALGEPLPAPMGRSALQQRARERFDIKTLCAEWSHMLTSLVTQTQLDIVPPFYVAPVFEAAGRAADGEVEAA